MSEHRPLLEAIAFSARAHRGQIRKDGETPYVSHVFRVCLVVRHVFGFDDPRMLAAAVLHDTIEDTTTDFDDIAEHFGPEIAQWVAFLTKNKALPEEERERDYMARLQLAPWQVKVCKLADIYDNLLDSAHLPAHKRPHSLARAEAYLRALQTSDAPQASHPLRLVQSLLDSARGA